MKLLIIIIIRGKVYHKSAVFSITTNNSSSVQIYQLANFIHYNNNCIIKVISKIIKHIIIKIATNSFKASKIHKINNI
jgi:hypothetical protein